MRNVLATFVVLPTIALSAPDILAAFEPALDQLPAQNNDTIAEDGTLELLKRQNPNECAQGYHACTNLNAPGLCCRTDQICSADGNNNVACCPQGAACTGTIGGVGGGSLPTASPTQSNPSSTVPFVIATTTAAATDTTFVQQSSGTNGPSTVPNPYYPFVFIPTTYTNAAACSSAYTSCSANAASCTAALANGQQGITVSAPNGGATITAVPSLGSSSAASICNSLSRTACSGLIVEACSSFGQGNAATRLCGDRYAMGAGVAIGLAGQLLR